MFVIGTCRNNMLVKLGELSVYLIAGSKHHGASLQRIVYGISATVGHAPVGIGITCIPVYDVRLKRMLTSKLCVVSSPAPIIIFRSNLIVRLGIHACTVGISVGSKLIEDILELIFVVA